MVPAHPSTAHHEPCSENYPDPLSLRAQAQLAIASLVAVGAMFAGGIATALLLRRV